MTEIQHTQPQRTSAYAVAGLVLSLVWLCGLGSIAGIALSAIGYRDARNGAANGEGIAIAGLTVGVVGLLVILGFFGVWFVDWSPDD